MTQIKIQIIDPMSGGFCVKRSYCLLLLLLLVWMQIMTIAVYVKLLK